jgi:transposase
MEKRKRRSFSKHYKPEVVELIRKSGKSIGAVARELDLSETAVRRWVTQAEIDSGRGPTGGVDDRGARRTRAAAQAGQDTRDGAGDPEKSDRPFNRCLHAERRWLNIRG